LALEEHFSVPKGLDANRLRSHYNKPINSRRNDSIGIYVADATLPAKREKSLQEQMNRRRQKKQSRFCEADFPKHPDKSYDPFSEDRKKTMYEARFPARGFLPNDPLLERDGSSGSSHRFNEVSFSSDEPFVQTNAKSVTNLSPQNI